MMGKIIGTSLAGLLQFFIWAILGLVLMFAASALLGIDASPAAKISPSVVKAAHQEFALQAFKFSALDYILKPADGKDLSNAIKKVEENLETNNIEMNMRILYDNLKIKIIIVFWKVSY